MGINVHLRQIQRLENVKPSGILHVTARIVEYVMDGYYK